MKRRESARIRLRRRQSRIVILVASSITVFFLTVLQLRAQFLASESVGRAAMMNGPGIRTSLNKTRRMLLSSDPDPSTKSNRIRYLAFGSSSTYGVGLGQPSSDKGENNYPHESYAHQVAQSLNADLVNAADRIDGSSLSAACTQTIVGNDANFDLISIEYSLFDQNVQVLASRLRKRFPLAKILFIELWNPLMLRYNVTKSSGDDSRTTARTFLDFNQWKEQEQGVDTAFDTKLSSFDLSLKISRDGSDRWSMAPPSDAAQKLKDDTVQSIDATVISLPKPVGHVLADPRVLREHLSWFQDDNPKVLSPAGQAALAQVVQNCVADVVSLPRPTHQPGALGSWGSGDHCNMWFSSGNFGSVVGANYRRVDFAHNEQNSSHKHAIEFRHLRGDTVKVSNPFSTPRMLYLTYMTAVEDGVYPRTKVRLNGIPTVQIDPFHDEEDQSEKEFARTTAVGMIPPLSTAAVRLDPLQRSALHFRLVGASLIADEMKYVPIEFSLEAETVNKQDTKSSFWGFW